jgi:anaerobic magnesium-protoporphyrin IX monomethyl ester cyclase
MKTILLSINAKYIHTNNAVRLLKANTDFLVDIMEYTIKDNIDEIVSDIESVNPDVLGFSVYIWNVSITTKIIDKLNLLNTKIVIGGPEVSYDSLYFISNHHVDFIIRGEGEIAFDKLLYALESNTDFDKVPNLMYLKDGNLINKGITEISNLDSLKQPYFMKDDIVHIPNKVSYIESSRGCPYKCSYCLSSLEEKVRFFNIEDVKKTILYLMEKGSKTIKFLDRTFNANKNTLDLLSFIIENNNNKTVFQFEITGDVLDQKIIHHLNEFAPKGLFRFEIGIQSINTETNKLVDRIQNTEKLFENIRLIQKGNVIGLHLDLIAGLPKEDLESFIITFDEVFKLGAKELQLGFLKMLRGTKIRREAKMYNYLYHDNAPYEIVSNDSISEEDILEIHLVEHMLDIYHNKGYFKENLLNYILSTNSPYMFFKEIGEYYIKNNYSFKGYQIEDVYKRLFSFIDDESVIYSLKKDYLRRSKIKPKIFWNNFIEKKEKREIFEKLSNDKKMDINIFYKYSIVMKHKNEYYIIMYRNLENHTYIIKGAVKK